MSGVDQHMLIALIAPAFLRGLVTGGSMVRPKGKFHAARNANPVYQLLGTDGLGGAAITELHHPIRRTIGYHSRAGDHDVNEHHWQQYLNFAGKHFRRPVH